MPVPNFPGRLPIVLLISLQRCAERRRGAIQALERLKLEHKWVKACDGNKLSLRELREAYKPANTLKIYSSPLGRGEIGCYLSHLECYRMMVDQNIPYAIIMEDDMRPNPNLIKALRALTLPKNWGLVHLWPRYQKRPNKAFMFDNIHERKKLFGCHYVSKYFYMCYHTHLYMITQEFAREMLSYLLPIRVPIDIALFDTLFSKHYPYAVYRIKNGRRLSPDVGKLAGETEMDTASVFVRDTRIDSPLDRGWVERLIIYLCLPWRLLFPVHIKKSTKIFLVRTFSRCLGILCYLPWSDERKPRGFYRAHDRRMLKRSAGLLSACRWSALLPWRS
jgi:glycosyl transferase family 25